MDISRDHLGSRVYMTGSQYVTKNSRWRPRWPPNITNIVLIYCLILVLCPYIVPYVSLCNLVGDHLRCKEIKVYIILNQGQYPGIQDGVQDGRLIYIIFYLIYD